jgi:CRISPR/Cas system-associated exonuclease Cas4 (RecB family)
VITVRQTRLIRVPDLRGRHHALARLIEACDPFELRRWAILVPTAGAGEALRRTLERQLLERAGRVAMALPDILTRAQLLERWHAHLPSAPAMLTEFEREVLFRRAARGAAGTGSPAPFHLRPALIPQILAFYDELRRRRRSVDDFARLVADTLAASADYDRGAARLLRQTEFLAAAFAGFERAVDESGRLDEHRLVDLLRAGGGGPHARVIVTVADQAADAAGLWTSDYDLLARMPGIERIDVVATERMLATGYLERIHDHLPGIEEDRAGEPASGPVLEIPDAMLPDAAEAPSWFVCRDREEELAEFARQVKVAGACDHVAVAFERPLPYLYLARSIFPSAGVPYQALDSLPLAAEPFAAAVDLVFTCVTTEATRAALVELLSSPHWRFTAAGGQEPARLDLAALDAWLREQKYLGGWDALPRLRERAPARVSVALDAAIAVVHRLRALASRPSASAQVRSLLAFVEAHERPLAADDPAAGRHATARAAVLSALESLAAASERYDDGALEPGELAGAVRRWIEGQAFSPRTGWSGVVLLDATAAAFADVDELRIVGLCEGDWPDRSGRPIFYPPSLLAQLGWAAETERLKAARAAFQDLLHLPRERLSVSTFTLEDDAIVSPSPFLEEVDASGLERRRRPSVKDVAVFTREALWTGQIDPGMLPEEAAAWLDLRGARTPGGAREFHGFTGGHRLAGCAVSHVERYLECPFKYYAAHVLRLDEERADESGLTPQERGQLLHDVFERFFSRWHALGRDRLSVENVGDALALFEEVAEERLASLSEADRGLERTYLLGSAASSGLAERAFAFEIEQDVGVMERLLEHPLEGEFEIRGTSGAARRLRIRAKADRIDLLEDGTLRVIDYKLGRAPKPARALQLPIYGACACQHLDGHRGRSWRLGRAGYVAFREKNAFVALGGSSSLEDAVSEGQDRFLDAVAGIERGEFPPDPDEPFLCSRCGYAGVCRKDYVGDD